MGSALTHRLGHDGRGRGVNVQQATLVAVLDYSFLPALMRSVEWQW